MKYLITQEQLDAVCMCLSLTSPNAAEMLASTLKPIEPLSDPEIAAIYFGATRQSLRPQDSMLAHSFAKAIEAHILGEKHENRE